MLAKSGRIPTGSGWAFEPKLDGFRCLVCTHDGGFKARSRRGWNMAELLPELAGSLPPNLQLDGELVALDDRGHPDFHLLGRRMLHGDSTVAVTYMVFDLLAVEGLPVMSQPYSERRALLGEVWVVTPHAQLVETFDDGEALFKVICDRGLEGIVAKRRRDAYRQGERLWVKTKNRATRRFAEELAGVRRNGVRRSHGLDWSHVHLQRAEPRPTLCEGALRGS
jgi:bifunctional non-homologous end joining protein LigD